MALQRYKIGDLIESVAKKWEGRDTVRVSGINGKKQFIDNVTPTIRERAELSGCKTVPPGCFAVNFMHVGRDEAVPAALNDSCEARAVSPAYFVFKVVREDILLKEYLFMLLRSREFDRYAWFCTDSSIRSNLEWSRFLSISLELPPVAVQQKYADIYLAAQANQKAYETGLEELKAVCSHTVGHLKEICACHSLAKYLVLSDERCAGRPHGGCKGITIQKEFVDTRADLTGVSLKNYLWVRPGYFAYAPVTSRNAESASVALNTSGESFPVSSVYTVFYVKDTELLLPEYLFLWFLRPEFDRYARFHSWGSSREVFSFSDLSKLRIPIPERSVQEGTAGLLRCLKERIRIRNSLEDYNRRLCPLLIKGSKEAADIDL